MSKKNKAQRAHTRNKSATMRQATKATKTTTATPQPKAITAAPGRVPSDAELDDLFDFDDLLLDPVLGADPDAHLRKRPAQRWSGYGLVPAETRHEPPVPPRLGPDAHDVSSQRIANTQRARSTITGRILRTQGYDSTTLAQAFPGGTLGLLSDTWPPTITIRSTKRSTTE